MSDPSPPDFGPASFERSWRRRLRCCDGLFIFALSLVCLRLVHVQYLQAETFAAKAHRQQVSQEVIRARPGDLLDREGRVLATSISVASLAVNPRRVTDPAALGEKLAAALQLDASELTQRLQDNSSRQFLWIKRRLSDEETSAVAALRLPSEQVFFEIEFQRRYPQGELAAHVVGFRDIDGMGQGGAEAAFDSLLTGVNGTRRFVRDARGYALDMLEEVTEPPQHGASVMLTIDLLLQLQLEQQLQALMTEHRALAACGIVLDPRNGEVLALGNRPTFNPALPESAAPEAWKNMALSAVYEPGSTFKPLVAAWGLEQRVLERDDWFHCHWGAYKMGGRTLHDHHPYGDLSLTDVLVKSSNIGMAKIGEKLGNERLYQLAVAFGFGRRTGIELPGEVPGLLRPLPQWNGYSTGSIPMGQELAATPLQLLTAHAVLANHGVSVTPHVLLRAGSDRPVAPVVTSRLISAETADWMIREPLTQVVERGTGTKARIAGVEVFGKTGTAQKMNPDGTYSHERHFSSFLCGAPANQPRLLVLISVDEPRGDDQYGGSVAAPYAAQVLRYALNRFPEETSNN